jgi:hypothetical protein
MIVSDGEINGLRHKNPIDRRIGFYFYLVKKNDLTPIVRIAGKSRKSNTSLSSTETKAMDKFCEEITRMVKIQPSQCYRIEF